MENDELVIRLQNCTFVIEDPEKCAIAVKDVPDGFMIVAKEMNHEAEQIVHISEQIQKLIVETPDVYTIYEKIPADVLFNQYDDFLIDIEEEFQLIKTGSKKSKQN